MDIVSDVFRDGVSNLGCAVCDDDDRDGRGEILDEMLNNKASH